MKEIPVSLEEVLGRVSAHDVVDPKTGEVLLECNQELTTELLDRLRAAGVREVEVLFIDDPHVGPSLRNTLLQDKRPVARGRDPGDLQAPAPGRPADASRRRPPSSTTCSSTPSATTSPGSAA